MKVRLCLPAGLLSQWLSLAIANNNGSRWRLTICATPSSSICEVNLYTEDTISLRNFLPFWNHPILSYGRSGSMSQSYSQSSNELAEPQLTSVDLRSSSGTQRRISDISDGIPNGLDAIRFSVHAGEFLNLEEKPYLELLHEAYTTELHYLMSAWVVQPCDNPQVLSKAPSQLLFGERHGEVDRTLTGLNALRWIYKNDYASYTSNQPFSTKLTKETFAEMRKLFLQYNTTQEILTIIMMQMTNDLGKSTKLHELYYGHGNVPAEINHDMVMYFTIRDRPELVSSFQRLPKSERNLVEELLRVSAEFNPSQLIQGECPPEAMLILKERGGSGQLTPEAIDKKFLELFLDMSGALGHINHEGAKTMTEAVTRSLMHALKVSKLVATGPLTIQEAYHKVLEHRLQILKDAGWSGDLKIKLCHLDFAKARVFCMGRVDNVQKAGLFEGVIDNLPRDIQDNLAWGLRIDHKIARQATYMPGMIASVTTAEQLEALLRYLARVLFISDSDLSVLPHNNGKIDAVIVERDVMPIIKPLISRKEEFKNHPLQLIDAYTPLPRLQILKRAPEATVAAIGDRPTYLAGSPRI